MMRARNLATVSKPPPAYRADIDGLRAVAVLLVVAFHLRSGWMPGGFVGVDVFFVISGYVVTSSLAGRDVGAGFGIVDFYGRRIKRLVPAVLVSVICTSVLYAVLVPPVPNEFNTAVYRTGMAAVFGMSNLYLLRHGTSYFDGDVLPNPFTHTWSLGVEEQFYLLFPLLWRIASWLGLLARRTPREVLITSVAAVAVLSCIVSAFWSQFSQSTAYYAMPSRFWELAIGSLIAFRSESIALWWRGRPRQASVGQALGLLLVFLAGAFTPSLGFPMPGALPAAIGAGLFIACGTAAPGLVGMTLTRPAFVYVGHLSYSLYLWHWPTIAIATRLYGENTPLTTIVAITAATLGTLASYHLIETPIRRRVQWRGRNVVLVGLAAALVACLGVDQLRRHRMSVYVGSPQRWSTDWAVDDGALVEGRIPVTVCHLNAGATLPTGLEHRCLFSGPRPAPYRLWSFGDSHAFANWPMLLSGVTSGDYDLYVLSHDGCAVHEATAGNDSCAAYWNYAQQTIRRQARAGDVVMVSAYLRSYAISSSVQRAFAELRAIALGRGATLLVQAPLPVQGRHAYDCIETPYSSVQDVCYKPRAVDQRDRREAASFVEHLAQEDGVAIWDPYDKLCPGPRCSPFRNGRPIFRDDDHLSLYGSRSLGPAFLSVLDHLHPRSP